MTAPVALLGWSLHALEALQELGRPFVVVAPEPYRSLAVEHGLEFVGWDFERRNEHSHELVEPLRKLGVSTAVPLYEETVTWAGAVNAVLWEQPRLFNQALLFRDKAMMKRKAQISGIRVGVFEEAECHEDVLKFLRRVNQALLKLEGDTNDPVHLKPFASAGCVGHRLIRTPADVHGIPLTEFPCLLESHLDGQEFSCEAFIHDGKIRFLNITEYVHLGHSNFVPASERLESQRAKIRGAVEELINAFDVRYGMIHPEWFITSDGKLNFGEVAARVPGGHIFELIQRAYGFNPFAGFALCCDPNSTEAELEAFFPKEDQHQTYAGSLMVYPHGKVASHLDVPKELEEDPYFESHNLFVPASPKVAARVGFGNHYGTIFFAGDDPRRMEDLMWQWERHDFYA
ncbi:MAG: ATP-grasp domain-containing protein [Planctomycetota bacterium]